MKKKTVGGNNKKSAKYSFVKWTRTDDKQGVKPNFDVTCPQCDLKMVLRNSELLLKRSNSYGRIQVEPILSVMFKCRPCAMVSWFYIGAPYVDNDYWNEITKRRDNHPLYVPPKSTWSDDAIIQQRLKDLGYFGGDVDYSEQTEVEE